MTISSSCLRCLRVSLHFLPAACMVRACTNPLMIRQRTACTTEEGESCPMRGKISKRTVDALKPGEMVADAGDGSIKGFTARRLPSGNVVYGFRFRDRATRKEHWIALGRHGNVTADEARTLAKQKAGELAFGNDLAGEREAAKAKAADANTVNALLDAFVQRHVRKTLRRAREIERIFDRSVRPHMGAKCIYALRRRDVVEMLDAVEDDGDAPVMADRTLAYLR